MILAAGAAAHPVAARSQMGFSLGWHIILAFFVEPFYLGIYWSAWDKLPPGVPLLSGLPIFAAGVASAFFVVTANSWMNTPAGYTLHDGRLTGVDPWAAMFNPSTGPETVHMI